MLAKQVLVGCLVVLTLAVYGCAPKMVSSDAAVYQTMKLYASSGKDVDAVYQAALKAMDKLQLKVTEKAKDAFGAKVVAKSSDDKSIVVSIKPAADKKTGYTIQVGTLGNEEQSRKIYAEIENALQGKAK
jgi:cell division septation protein DedD